MSWSNSAITRDAEAVNQLGKILPVKKFTVNVINFFFNWQIIFTKKKMLLCDPSNQTQSKVPFQICKERHIFFIN
jgi:hypothetical protein